MTRSAMERISSGSKELMRTASPRAGQRPQRPVHIRTRADIDARGRLVQDEQTDLTAPAQPPTDHQLLLVAARERPRRRRRVRRRDAQRLRSLHEVSTLAPAPAQPPLGQSTHDRQDHVVLGAQYREDRLLRPVGRDESHPRTGWPTPPTSARSRRRPRSSGWRTVWRRQLRAPRRIGRNPAGRTCRRSHLVEPRTRSMRHCRCAATRPRGRRNQHSAPGPASVGTRATAPRSPDHRVAALFCNRPLKRDLTVAQHSDRVGEGQHLVKQVRDEQDRDPLGLEAAQQPPEALHVGVVRGPRSLRRGPGFEARSRWPGRWPRAVGARGAAPARASRCRRRVRAPPGRPERSGAARAPAAADPTEAPGRGRDSRDRPQPDQLEVLKDDRNAQRLGLPRRQLLVRDPVKGDGPRLPPHPAAQTFDQSALPGAVGAQQSVDLSGANREEAPRST